jgi:uncharacterized hydrophobic protein (TIGR00271 family)
MNLARMISNLRPTITSDARDRACQRIIEPSQPTSAFYLLVCLSAIIATFGLLANSTAVVIGAMLVAPLMGPIFGIALGLSNGDRQLLKTAMFAEIIGIILAIGLPAIIGLIQMRPDFGSEIIARTQPTIYDVLIALASGLAGAYALADERISPALPGVAIATALVPPLAVCGLNLAAGNWSMAWGAFLLFLVNFIAIEFAAASIFMFMGLVEFPQSQNGSTFKVVIQRLGVSFVILLLAGMFMTQTLINIIGERKLEKEIRMVLTEELSAYAGARISDLKFNKKGDGLEVMAVVITPQEIDSSRVVSLEKGLKEAVNPNSELIVRSVMSKDADRNGPVFISDEELQRLKKNDEEVNFMNTVSKTLSGQIKKIDRAQLIDVGKDINEGVIVVIANVRTPKAITPAEVQSIEQELDRELKEPVKLVVRSILTQDADSTNYLENSTSISDSLQGEDLDLYKRLLNEIMWILSQENPGASVVELSFEYVDNAVLAYTAINTPNTLSPAQVAKMQKRLQDGIDSRIRITVRSIVGGISTADGYIK